MGRTIWIDDHAHLIITQLKSPNQSPSGVIKELAEQADIGIQQNNE